MAYNALNNLIDAYIYANGVQAITGQILNGVLKQMVSQLGSGYHLMGVAGPGTVPASNDYAMAYFSATAGEYTDFGGITLAPGEVAVLLTYGNGSWEKQTIYNVPTGTADLENTANFITNAVTDLVNYYTKGEIDTALANYPTLSALAMALADYYTKAETDAKFTGYYKKTEIYDKAEVDSIVSTLSRQEYIIAWDGLSVPDVSTIPIGVTVTYSGDTYTGTLAPSSTTLNKIYMVWNGVAYDMYATTRDGSYSWVPMGTTTVDLSQYATKEDLELLSQKEDLKIDGVAALNKSLIWADGYVAGGDSTITYSPNAIFCQPVLLKAGEKLVYKTSDTFQRAVMSVPNASPVAVGDVITGDVLINYNIANTIAEFIAENDTYIIISVMKASNTVEFYSYQSGSINSKIAKQNQEILSLAYNNTFEQEYYPTEKTSIGFGANAGQKLSITCTTTGSLGYGWFVTGEDEAGAEIVLAEYYSSRTNLEVVVADSLNNIYLRIAGNNTGTVTVGIALENWRSDVDNSIRWLKDFPSSVYDVANLFFSESYEEGNYPISPMSIGFGVFGGAKMTINANTTGSLGYGWFISGRKSDGTISEFVARYTNVTNYIVTVPDDFDELYLRIAANNSGTQSITIKIENWRSEIDQKVSEIKDDIEGNNKEAIVALAASRVKPDNYGYPSENSLLSILITTDVHSDWVRFERALEFANNSKIDQFICLGDLGDDPDQMRAYDYADAVSKCSKPCLFIPGNHEVVGDGPLTNLEMMQIFYSPELQAKNGDIHPAGKVYWHKDVPKTFNVGGTNVTKTLRIIGMDQYEYCPALDKNTEYHTQEQIDWLIGLLDSADEDTYVLLLSHGAWGNRITIDRVDCSFSWEDASLGKSQDASNNPDFIPNLVNAWISGARFVSSQTMEADDSVISVDHQFANVKRNFICFLSGHAHFDMVGVYKYAGDLVQVVLNCTSAAGVQQQSDLPRDLSGKTQDCVTAITYDWYKERIYLIRFGSDVTHEMTERKYISLSPAE